MADRFFDYDTTLSRDEECTGDIDDDEQEYDALNDETFGDCDIEANGTGPFDDWETQHEQLAEIAENTKKNHNFELKLSKLIDDDDDDDDDDSNNDSSDIWAVTKSDTTNLSRTKDVLSSQENLTSVFNQPKNGAISNGLVLPKNFCTVEELERSLLTNSTPKLPPQQQQLPARFPPGLNTQQQVFPPPGPHFLPPPGLAGVPPPSPNVFRFLSLHPLLLQQQQQQQHNLPTSGLQQQQQQQRTQIRQNVGNFHQKNLLTQPNRSNFPIPSNVNFHKNHRNDQNFQPYNHIRSQYQENNNTALPPPPFMLQQQQHHHHHHHHQQQQHQHHNHQQQNSHNRSANFNHNNNTNRHNNINNNHRVQSPVDEYTGLMSNREKQWLINIQLLQLNTGTPYFDDFYYTVFVDRQNKLEKENRPNHKDHHHHHHHNNNNNNNNNNRNNNGRYHNQNRHNQNRKDDERNHRDQNNTTTQIHRTYTPLQFENSLGKLQCGSVTAPRKIIDMDVVAHEKDSDNNQTLNIQRDVVRRTKQTLLELEALFNLVLRLEDLNNPIAIANTLKLREIKEKQKIQQLETATTEEKEEILKQLQEETLVKNDNKEDLFSKIFAGVLFEDKLLGYMGVRKGKMLLLRLLPHLNKTYSEQHLEIWMKILAAVPIVGKKDQITDNILPQFFHLFDRFVDECNMDCVLKLASVFNEMKNTENIRSTPIFGKNLMISVLSNKLGISCTTKLIERSETLLIMKQVNETQQQLWIQFLNFITDTIPDVDMKMEHPMQPLEQPFLENHLKRFATTFSTTTTNHPSLADRYTMFTNVFCGGGGVQQLKKAAAAS